MKIKTLYHLRILSTSRFLKITFFGLLGLSVFLFFTPADWYPAWFKPRVTAVGNLLILSAVLIPDMLLPFTNTMTVRDIEVRYQTLLRLSKFMAIGVLLNLIGVLGLFELVHLQYDKVIHFIFPYLLFISLVPFLQAWFSLPLRKTVSLACLIVVICIIGWEILEYASDRLLGTNAFGQRGEHVAVDTALDVGFGILGITAGLIGPRPSKNLPALFPRAAASRRL